jgi:hypothetical protein
MEGHVDMATSSNSHDELVGFLTRKAEFRFVFRQNNARRLVNNSICGGPSFNSPQHNGTIRFGRHVLGAFVRRKPLPHVGAHQHPSHAEKAVYLTIMQHRRLNTLPFVDFRHR